MTSDAHSVLTVSNMAGVFACPPAVPLARSNRPEVRNPVVLLPSAQKLKALPDSEAKTLLRATIRELCDDCRAKGNAAWAKKKWSAAAYWKINSVYARHLSVLLK